MRFLSKTAGIGGSISKTSEGFFVQEMLPDGTVLPLDGHFEPPAAYAQEGKFCHFVLCKKNWTTSAALKALSRQLRITPKRFNFAGTKDRNATTSQLVSCFALAPEKLGNAHVKDITIPGAWNSNNKVSMGNLAGNKFTIKWEKNQPSDEKNELTVGVVNSILKENSGYFPNYYGSQRFGSMRENTHLVGLKLLKNDLAGAVEEFLSSTSENEPLEWQTARKELASTRDYKAALQKFPSALYPERRLLEHLSKQGLEKDFAGALRLLPRELALMFVHSVQSHVFNKTLDSRFDAHDFGAYDGEYYCQKNPLGFFDANLKTESQEKGKNEDGKFVFNLAARLVGFETAPETLNPFEKTALEALGISPLDFKLKSMPELSAKGACRTAFSPLVNFSFDGEWFSFALQPGSYATVAVQEFLKP